MATRSETGLTGLQAPYVRGDAETLRAALLVAPSPSLAARKPLQSEPNSIPERAEEQHALFAARLAAHGVGVRVLPPSGAALGALCADAAVIFPDGAFVLRPSELNRRGEIVAIEAALQSLGVPILARLASPGLLDGGDVMFSGDTLYLGVATSRDSEIGLPGWSRGNAHGRAQVAAYARDHGWKVVEVALASEAIRLRAVAALVAPDAVVLSPALCDAAAFAGLQIIEAPRGEDCAAGVLALGNRRVIANVRFRQTIPLLRKAKIAVDAIDLWEFGKIGATPALLALALKRG
jgi:dimethylargininase